MEKGLLMANIKISQLTPAASALTSQEFEVNQAGLSRKVTGQQIVDLVEANLGTIATQDSSSVAITGGSISGITDLAIADGGTGASTAQAARNNLLPTQAGNTGKFLTTNGTDVSLEVTGVQDGDKGDITVTGDGTVWSIDPNAVTTDKILDEAVTTAKLSTTGVTPGTYGSTTQIPIINVDNKGRLNSVSTANLTVSGTLIGYRIFTTTGTYNKATNNPSFVIVEVVGGGGSGGGTGTRANGGTSSFGAFCSASGGAAGSTAATSGEGGSGSNGDLNVSGTAGSNGGTSIATIGGFSKFGGSVGRGGAGSTYSSGKSTVVAGAGGGGGYAMRRLNASSLASSETVTVAGSSGGTIPGSAGLVIVWEYR